MALTFKDQDSSQPLMSKINTTPLVDVMLVLLIIFLITIPAVNSSIPIRLPKEVNQARDPKPDNIILSVNTSGAVYWFDAKLASRDELVQRLKEAAKKSPQPEVQLRGDAKANFETIGRVLFDIQSAGLEKVGFITETPAR
jgi:biopolymer transport protein ExbD